MVAMAWDNQQVDDVLDEALRAALGSKEPDLLGCAVELACARRHVSGEARGSGLRDAAMAALARRCQR